MSKKDYEALAKALGESLDIEEAVARVSSVLAQDNPEFRPRQFFDAVVKARAAKFGDR